MGLLDLLRKEKNLQLGEEIEIITTTSLSLGGHTPRLNQISNNIEYYLRLENFVKLKGYRGTFRIRKKEPYTDNSGCPIDDSYKTTLVREDPPKDYDKKSIFKLPDYTEIP